MSSSRNWEKDISSGSSEELNNVEERVRDVDISTRLAKRVCKEHEVHDETTNNDFPKMVKLNVGGHLFSTSLATLNKDPGSKLHAMFSGRFDTKPSEDGSYFMDRDGTHFRHILNYLRTGLLIVPKDETIRMELLAEADFYQIEGIVKPLRSSFFKDSVILTLEQRQTLVTWLKETGPITIASEKLLYRVSRDGWHPSTFHRCCDNKGPTVTVAKSRNYIFGGYTDQSWDGSSSYKRAPDSFLFSLVNPSGLPPTKMALKPGEETYAIYCTCDYGPIFGRGCDLQISNQTIDCSCSVKLNYSYQCPTGQDTNTFLTGNQWSAVSEMEVFGFDKY